MRRPFVACILAALISLPAIDLARARAQGPQIVAQPDHWIPYTATRVFRSTAGGEQFATEYRNARGSIAVYMWPVGVGPVTIHNGTTGLTYVRMGPDSWISYSLQQVIPEAPPAVAKWRPNALSKLADRFHGMEVYQLTSASGTLTKIVPALNGLIVYARNASGAGLEYSDLVVGEPSPDVFLPPAGATVKPQTAPPGRPVAPGVRH